MKISKGNFENIDISIDIDKDNLKNINSDIDMATCRCNTALVEMTGSLGLHHAAYPSNAYKGLEGTEEVQRQRKFHEGAFWLHSDAAWLQKITGSWPGLWIVCCPVED